MTTDTAPSTAAFTAVNLTGTSPLSSRPSFPDARVGDVLRQASKAGLKPRSDAELLPVLLGLVAAKTPVDASPTQMTQMTQMTRQQKTDRARELARAAAFDRPAPAPTSGPSPAGARVLHRQGTAGVETEGLLPSGCDP
ncbi:hypothetical protein [Streptomyces sp. NPDC048357]|uniref:hypothetical protein n=1 Tax=Streptomyces sp. NPDC048357 TaxID=3154719 RepID=UPI0034205F2F